MRIDIVSQSYPPDPTGGFVADLAEHCASKGNMVVVWTANAPPEGTHCVRLESVGHKTYARTSLLSRFMSQASFCLGASKVPASATEEGDGARVVLVVGNPPLCSLALPAFRSDAVVHWVMDVYPEILLALRGERHAARVAAPLLRLSLDAAFGRARAIVAISPRMAHRLRSRIPTVPIHTIPLWSPVERFPQEQGRLASSRRRRGIGVNTFVVLYHGNLGLSYDFAPIIAAAEELRPEPDVCICIVGDGAQRDAIEGQVASRGLPNVRVLQPVPRPELADSLAVGDVQLVVLPPALDGLVFPAKLITGLAAGRPTILLSNPESEVGELLASSGAGIVVRPTGSALAECIRRLCRTDRAELAAMGRAARYLYEKQFARALALGMWDRVLLSSASAGRFAV